VPRLEVQFPQNTHRYTVYTSLLCYRRDFIVDYDFTADINMHGDHVQFCSVLWVEVKALRSSTSIPETGDDSGSLLFHEFTWTYLGFRKGGSEDA